MIPEYESWCHPLKISFTDHGKRLESSKWIQGYNWGLSFYPKRGDDGLIFTIRLKIEAFYSVPMGPNKFLAPIAPSAPKPKLQEKGPKSKKRPKINKKKKTRKSLPPLWGQTPQAMKNPI